MKVVINIIIKSNLPLTAKQEWIYEISYYNQFKKALSKFLR